jgi:hypothetical protein
MGGHSISERHWSPVFADAQRLLREVITFASDYDPETGEVELSERVDEMAIKLATRLEVHPKLGIARRRIRSEGVQEVLVIGMSVLIGRVSPAKRWCQGREGLCRPV